MAFEQSLQISDLCSMIVNREPIIVQPGLLVAEAAILMHHNATSCLIIVEEQQQFLGLFTGEDVIRVLASGIDPQATRLSEVVVSPVPVILDKAVNNAQDIWLFMQQSCIRYLPVVSTSNQPVGLITASTLLPPLLHLTEQQQAQPSLEQLNIELKSHIHEHTTALESTIQKLQQEITNRQRIETLLLQNEAQLQQLAASVPGMIYQYLSNANGSTALIYVSPACQEIYGVSSETALESPNFLWKIIHPDDLPIVLDRVATAIAQLEPFKEEYRIIASGQVKWLRDEARPDSCSDGNVIWHGIIVDITERKQIEEALQHSEEKFRLFFDESPFGIILTDQHQRFIQANPAYCQLFGYSEAELLTMSFVELIHPDDLADDLNLMGQIFDRQLTKFQLEKRFLKHNGELFWAHLTVVPIFAKDGNLLYRLGTIKDITESKQAEEEILNALGRERELNELKSAFITTVSHEFRTPLSIILSSTELLERYGQQWSEKKRQLRYRRIIEAVDRITTLLNDVLIVGKAEAGKLEFNPTPVNLLDFCYELIEDISLKLDVIYTLKFIHEGCNSFNLYLDTQLLCHILHNLISNAIKYSPQGGEIQLKLLCHNQEVIFQIYDEGIGIAQEDQDQLFTVFNRGGNVGTISGTGLGLSIVKQCVDLHGGNITVESELGKGTLMTIKIPLHKI